MKKHIGHGIMSRYFTESKGDDRVSSALFSKREGRPEAESFPGFRQETNFPRELHFGNGAAGVEDDAVCTLRRPSARLRRERGWYRGLIYPVPFGTGFFCAIRPEGDRRARTSGHPTGNGAERPVDVRLAPTGAERRPSSGNGPRTHMVTVAGKE